MGGDIRPRLPRPLSGLDLLVQVDEDHPEREAPHNRGAEHREHDAVALAIAVVLEAPHVAAGHVAKLAEGVDHGDGDGTLGGGSREGRGDPRVENDKAGIGRRLKEQGNVARSHVLRRHADYKANDSDTDRSNDMPKLLASPVGVHGVDQRDDAREHPRRRAHEQGRDILKAKSTGQRGLLIKVSQSISLCQRLDLDLRRRH